jgi:aldehyde:ferredoxin oxidoreductase
MYGGYIGKIARIDLSKRKVYVQQLENNLIKDYIGGSGIGAKLLYEEKTEKMDPLSPNSLIIFMTGPLTRSEVPGTGRHEVIFKSPLANIFARSSVGGNWGVKLKKSGFDGIIISGKSENPVYLWIHEGKVEFRDANYLWGNHTYDVDKILKEETEKRASTAVIGPVGEKKIKISCIVHDGNHSHVAGRCGGGALMGSKNLKAIVVYGTQPVFVCKPEKLKNYLRGLIPHIKEATKGLSEFGNGRGNIKL